MNRLVNAQRRVLAADQAVKDIESRLRIAKRERISAVRELAIALELYAQVQEADRDR